MTNLNYVAKANNWEQRIKGENMSARIWADNWGDLFGHEDKDYSEKIARLEAEIYRLPAQNSSATSHQVSYSYPKPYKEISLKKKYKSNFSE
mmetsp:Transcript_38691/g.46661  ORF Transcript_38691/g.46661 Transcript_38691/m.46661 type:complete len:92 (+) Transcript_38691:72-347(+)|eukprot:CAMPEP_0194354620 /NCGR_PEP_ID=MMETSP0174-20130528/2730_1 /TAXON_ID=216777 /ORGANISM="Proboscia alata, Strain PI-D3" /LENGTH=91 /DNA_ID=CAMNT_0039123625 /DNA_START=35 /DNA_END=310 /DNA_ORIENTATION=+